MQSSLISKIEKAKRYAMEKDRVSFSGLEVSFRGDHDTYAVSYKDDKWSCSCHFFPSWNTCHHIMAVQHILLEMLPKESLDPSVALSSAFAGR